MSELQTIYEQADLLYDLQQIDQALDDLAGQIHQRYAASKPLFLCAMNGAVMTAGHLLPKLTFPLELDYIHATRYGDNTEGGELAWRSQPSTALDNREVIIIEDIYDRGDTLQALRAFCEQAGAKSVSCVALINKLHDQKVGPTPEFIGLTVPDRYVFGFGMDYKNYWRNAPGIFAVAGM